MKKSLKRMVIIIASIGLFSPNYTQYQLSPLAPDIIATFQLTLSQFSSIFSAPMIPAIFIGLLSGLLVDKYGMKTVIGIALIIAAVGSCLRIFAVNYTTLYSYMIMVGMGATFLNPNSAKIVGSFFPPEKVSSKVSILFASATLAMTIGFATTAFFPSIKSAFIVAGAISVLAAGLWWIFMKEPNKIKETVNNKMQTISMKEGLLIVIKNKPVWIIGFCLFGILACNVAMNSFLPTALIQRGIDQVTAGMYSSITTIGYLVGCLTAPIITTKLGKMKPVLFVMGIIAVLGAGFAWQLPEGILLGAGLFIAGGAMSGMMPLLFSIPIQLPEIGAKYAGTAGGFTSTLELLGAVLVPAYIITPIAGSNMTLYFILSGACMAIVSVLVLFLPEVMKGQKASS